MCLIFRHTPNPFRWSKDEKETYTYIIKCMAVGLSPFTFRHVVISLAKSAQDACTISLIDLKYQTNIQNRRWKKRNDTEQPTTKKKTVISRTLRHRLVILFFFSFKNIVLTYDMFLLVPNTSYFLILRPSSPRSTPFGLMQCYCSHSQWTWRTGNSIQWQRDPGRH